MLTAEQLEMRATGIGASEIAAVVDRHPYMSQADLYMQKTGGRKVEQTIDMERGNRKERYIADWAADLLGVRIVPCGTVRHSEHDCLLATPDRLIVDVPGDVVVGAMEVKAPRMSTGWTHPDVDPDGYPEHVMIQLAAQLGVLRSHGHGIDAGYIATEIHGEPWTYRVQHHEDLWRHLEAEGVAWWQRHMVAGVPPQIDGSKGARAYLDDKHRDHTQEVMTSTPEIEEAIFRLRELDRARDEISEQRALLENQIKDHIGEKSGVAGPWGRITWIRSKDSERWDTKALNQKLKEDDTLAEFRTVKPGARTFRAKWTNHD